MCYNILKNSRRDIVGKKLKSETKTSEVGNEAVEVKSKSKAVEIIINVVLVLVVLFAIFVGFTAYVSESGSGVPTFFGYRPFAVQTDSMEPTISVGDLIIDTVVEDPSELEVGDIITYWTIIDGQQVLNTHRITEITDYDNYLYFDTKGDNNTIEDSTGVHENDIVGEYLFAIPNLGTMIDFLTTGTGFLLVIVVPVFIFFVFQVVTFFKALFAYQKEKVRLQMLEEQNKMKLAMEAEAKQAEEAKAEKVEEEKTETSEAE